MTSFPVFLLITELSHTNIVQKYVLLDVGERPPTKAKLPVKPLWLYLALGKSRFAAEDGRIVILHPTQVSFRLVPELSNSAALSVCDCGQDVWKYTSLLSTGFIFL